MELFRKEFSDQNITDFHIWPALWDLEKPFRGVSQAHKQIVRFAQKEKLQSVLIAEDDVKFTALGAKSDRTDPVIPVFDVPILSRLN